jgi:chromate transport protein ChrA
VKLEETAAEPAEKVTIAALVRLALFYGVAGFGGGYSVLAQLRRDLVEERRWVGGIEHAGDRGGPDAYHG